MKLTCLKGRVDLAIYVCVRARACVCACACACVCACVCVRACVCTLITFYTKICCAMLFKSEYNK